MRQALRQILFDKPGFPQFAGTVNFTRANNTNLLAAMKATKANAADTVVAWMGDSTVQGQNSTGAGNTNSATNNATKQASDLLQAAGIPSSCDGFWGSVDGGTPTWANFLAANPKFASTGSGWGFQFTSVGGELLTSSDTTSTFTYTTAKSCNTMDVYFLTVSGAGDFKVTVDAGAEGAAQSTSTGGARGMGKITYALGSSAAHAVKFRCSATTVWIIGVHFYDTATRRVIVQNQGAGGWQIADWIDTSNGESAGNQYFNTGANLAIAEAGLVNSRNAQSAAASSPGMQTIITNYKAHNTTVWLFNPEPYLDDPINADYAAMLAGLSNSNGCTYTDTTNPYATPALWTAAGFGDGTVHPLGAGYGFIAGREAALMQAVWAAA